MKEEYKKYTSEQLWDNIVEDISDLDCPYESEGRRDAYYKGLQDVLEILNGYQRPLRELTEEEVEFIYTRDKRQLDKMGIKKEQIRSFYKA